MDVTAVYELPVPIWVTCSALGRTYPTGYGGLRFEVMMPQDRPPTGVGPVVAGIMIPDSLVGESVVWTREYGAFIPNSLRPATAVHRVVITAVEAPTDPARSWRGPDRQLAELVDAWFDRVRTWAEIVSGQDLDPHHRIYDAEISGAGLTFIAPPHEGSLGMTLTTPSVLPLRAQEWQVILAAVRDGQQPPLEELLSRNARAAERRGFHRRATIDAAAALEVALARILAGQADRLPGVQRARLGRGPTLGAYISIAKESGVQFDVAFEDLWRLSRSRNDAVHLGQAPTAWETTSLVQVAIDFLGAHGLSRRTSKREPDGSEWVTAAEVDDPQ